MLVRNLAQLDSALKCGARTLYCEFEDPKKYREAVLAVRCAGSCGETTREVFVAPPRIFKMGEEWVLKLVQSSNPDGYLVMVIEHIGTKPL